MCFPLDLILPAWKTKLPRGPGVIHTPVSQRSPSQCCPGLACPMMGHDGLSPVFCGVSSLSHLSIHFDTKSKLCP